MTNPNNLTDQQVQAGYSTVPGNFDPLTGQAKVPTTPTGLSSIATPPPTSTTSGLPSSYSLPPSQPGQQSGQGLDNNSFLTVLNGLNQGFQTNNEYTKQKNAVVNAMLGGQVSPDQLATLPDNIKSIIQSGDRNQLMLQAQILNDQISGYGKGVASSIQYLTQGYQKSVDQAEQQKKDDLDAVKEYFLGTGDIDTFKNFMQNNYSSLLGKDKVDNIINQAISSVTPVDAAMGAIVGNESGGNYQAVSKPIVSGQYTGHQSYGKYQVLDINIPAWTKEATGIAMTPQQFLANPEAQDAVAKMQIGNLWDKYKNIADVASVWFTGKPAADSKGLKDSTTGMTSEEYIQKATDAFNKLQSTPQEIPGKEYNVVGLLSKTDFKPTDETDKNARNYLDSYFKSTNGSLPTAASLFGSSRGAAQQKFVNAQDRAKELFAQATGQSLPSMADIQGTWKIINQNKGILNKINIASDTVEKNFKLAIDGEITNNVNKNATVINKILNPIYLALGDPAVNQALVSNGTITQEFANLISTRNAQGTLEADKRMAEELLPFGTSVEAQKAVVTRLVQEGLNIKKALADQQDSLYQQVDPLQMNSNNPARTDGSDLTLQVKNAGYDYDKMKADGYSDDEIKKALNLK